MFFRHAALRVPLRHLVALSILGGAVTIASSARASACGDDYYVVPADGSITFEPAQTCLTVTLGGAEQPGCDQLLLNVASTCTASVTVQSPSLTCVESDAGCEVVPAGGERSFYLAGGDGKLGQRSYDVDVSIEGVETTMHVSFLATEGDGGDSGCAIGPAHDARSAWLGVVGAALAVALCRRRRAR